MSASIKTTNVLTGTSKASSRPETFKPLISIPCNNYKVALKDAWPQSL